MSKEFIGPSNDRTIRFIWEGCLETIQIDVRNHVVVRVYSSFTGEVHRHNKKGIKPVLMAFYKVDRCDFVDCFQLLAENDQNPAYCCMKQIMDKEKHEFFFHS